jgi:hypothetical protein
MYRGPLAWLYEGVRELGMVLSPANNRLRVVRVVCSRPRVLSLLLLLSGGVVGSSVSFWALGIWELNCTMGGCESKILSRAFRFMLATLASVASGRDELEGDELPAWIGAAFEARSTGLSDTIWGEKRLTWGAPA